MADMRNTRSPGKQVWREEIRAGRRFRFGRNWTRFSSVIDENRIEIAAGSLEGLLGAGTLRGKSFLDAGCGSGLFSVAARQLEASRVHSFDFDPESVDCARSLHERYRLGDERWTIEQGSVLDPEYLETLGTWDIVYSWGVLHHTGDLWRALELVAGRVSERGVLFISIYNDEGASSRRWRIVKRVYSSSLLGRVLVTGIFVPLFAGVGLIKDLIRVRNPLRRYREYRQQRGMSVVFDWLDWLGGYPFEVAKVDEVVSFLTRFGFSVAKLAPSGGRGCNEFLFRK